ncbi:GH3 auxin-responsive promoter family protein [bacterium SCSIO 12741]|nr:GH3 auxin-responsive promoter family protein [bacterium SCSIO 12741]
MALVNSIAGWILKKRMHQIELFKKYPIEVQNEWFNRLIGNARHTEFGRKYRFEKLEDRKRFSEEVPLQDYESLKGYIDRIMKGEQNLLWPTEIKWFAKSSGTTSDKSKFIPVSRESLENCHYKGGTDLLTIHYCNQEDPHLFDGKGLILGGSSEVNKHSKNSYSGDLSSIIIKNLPAWAEYLRVPDLSIALTPQWEKKIDKMAEVGAVENITSISGVPSWNLLLLNRILEITGKSNMMEVWPQFELYGHGGVSFHPYREKFKELFPSDRVRFLESYNASEGFFGLQDRWLEEEEDSDMLLMLDYGIYYEFLPLDELHKDRPQTVLLEETELNKDYALIISTNAGLWRYMVGDTIRFTSQHPYRIQVSGRTKYYINAFGEELVAENAEKALAVACKDTGSTISEYTAAPYFDGVEHSGGHEWIIEFSQAPSNLATFTQRLDEELKKVNSDYEAKRYKDMNMKLPRVTAVEPGTFYAWLKSKGKLGGQNKVPRLSNKRKIIEEIHALLQQS